jgi:hypothetical protein
MIWLALAFLLLAILGSVTYAGVRAWRLWQAFRRLGSGFGDAMGRVMSSADEAERHASALTGNADRLASATARLQASLAMLAVLRAAYAESRGAFSSVRNTVPRK